MVESKFQLASNPVTTFTTTFTTITPACLKKETVVYRADGVDGPQEMEIN